MMRNIKIDINEIEKRIKKLREIELKQLLLNQRLIELYTKALYAKY